MRYRIAMAAMLASLWAAPAAAQTNCAQFQVVGGGARVEYNPFDFTDAQSTFDLRVEALADGVGAVSFLLVDSTPETDGPRLGRTGPAVYEVQWLGDATRRVFTVGNELLGAANGAQVRLAGRGRIEMTRLRLVIARGQEAPSQMHREDLTVRYQCFDDAGNPLGPQQEQPASIVVEADVPGYTAAYIGGIGETRGAIEFGQIGPSSNLSRSISVTALSTVPYDVLIESDNRGQLRRAGAGTGGIPYQMRYGGAPIASGERLTCPTTPAPLGRIEELEIALDRPSVASAPAGDYSDVLTLTFRPRDGYVAGGCGAGR